MAPITGERGVISDEIVPGDRSGGTNTSHTIIVPALQQLLGAVDRDAEAGTYERFVLEENVLGKQTAGARQRTFRYLRELYLLRPDSILFRALRDLWTDDPAGQPLLAGLCALARDAVFRASAPAVLETNPGDELVSSDLAEAIEKAFPVAYNESTLAKTGRNTFASWEQTGHLAPASRALKIRRRPVCTPATTAYALLLGHLEGVRGSALFDAIWVRALDQPRMHLIELATVASQRSLIEFRHSRGVTDVGFAELLRPLGGQLL